MIPEPTPEEIAEAEAAHAAFAAGEDAVTVARVAATSVKDTMFGITDDLIDWCQDATAFLFTGGQYGAFDPMLLVPLLQRSESALLAYKALGEHVPQTTCDQRDWMLQRGQQAQTLLALGAVMS